MNAENEFLTKHCGMTNCLYCGHGGSGRLITRDHKVPKSSGGCNARCNTVPACAQCNHAKGAMTVEQFRQFKKSQTTRETFVFWGESNKWWKDPFWRRHAVGPLRMTKKENLK